MVPHRVTGMSLFSMLYGCEALLPEKIKRTRYGSVKYCEKAMAGHRGDAGHPRASIGKLLPLFRCLGKYFNQKYVMETVPYSLVMENVVLMNVKRQLSDLKTLEYVKMDPTK